MCLYSGVEPLGSEWSSEALLWFQTLVDGEQLSARVVSVTEQGYGVELESRGQNVAAALISEQLAKAPGVTPKETHETAGRGAKHEEKIKENEHNQIHAQASDQTGASSKEIPTEGQTAILSEGCQLEFWCLKDEMQWLMILGSCLKLCVTIMFQPHLSQWTGRQWSCLSTRPFSLTLQPSLVRPSSTCSVPARVRTLTSVPVCHKKIHKW